MSDVIGRFVPGWMCLLVLLSCLSGNAQATCQINPGAGGVHASTYKGEVTRCNTAIAGGETDVQIVAGNFSCAATNSSPADCQILVSGQTGVTINGAGYNTTVITRTGYRCNALIYANSSPNTVIQNLGIVEPTLGGDSFCASGGSIVLSVSDSSTVYQVEVDQGPIFNSGRQAFGLVIAYSDGVAVYNNSFHGAHGYNIYAEYSDYLTITTNDIYNSWDAGLFTNTTNYLDISYNNIFDNHIEPAYGGAGGGQVGVGGHDMHLYYNNISNTAWAMFSSACHVQSGPNAGDPRAYPSCAADIGIEVGPDVSGGNIEIDHNTFSYQPAAVGWPGHDTSAPPANSVAIHDNTHYTIDSYYVPFTNWDCDGGGNYCYGYVPVLNCYNESICP